MRETQIVLCRKKNGDPVYHVEIYRRSEKFISRTIREVWIDEGMELSEEQILKLLKNQDQ